MEVFCNLVSNKCEVTIFKSVSLSASAVGYHDTRSSAVPCVICGGQLGCLQVLSFSCQLFHQFSIFTLHFLPFSVCSLGIEIITE